MKTEALRTVYFLGIGGIGMSALARYLNKAGADVHGYDKTPTSLTAMLEAEGMKIHYEDRPDLIPEETDLIVYTPAIPENLEEFRVASSGKFRLVKRSALLGEITGGKKTLAVAGTHGKTTVSSMLAHIMYHSLAGCTAFLGGIAKNYNSNLLLKPESEYMVTEADEFDRSFLKLSPLSAVITSVDADHLDIYHTHDLLKESFAEFTGRVRENGSLVIKKGLDIQTRANPGVKIYRYALNETADFHAINLRRENGQTRYDIVTPGSTITDIAPALPGLFNIENSIAAAAISWLNGATNEEIRAGINTFTGVKRRFDYRVIREDTIYIDDYAHHPEELRACIQAVRELYPGKHITGIFQPHLYSRTRDFATEFGQSLSLLDRVILLEIYPARELPVEGVNSAMLLNKITLNDKQLCLKTEIPELINRLKPEILLTLGAGDIDQLADPITALLNRNEEK
ncbi:UDP-N-acetylmuramate--L-alanine ligase [Lentimicrobium sp.]|uniref:UDP-N-acetylmuramate--L-alanine ligase n=1 Tax=Lentimicrobium sp. TaxID=2034841 RepID=UPI0025F47D50|nr:UDP-N-acetylmuramate--L-alanine ligase [Lentimicrobium sp.]HOP13442.1 UDP-N-acetylmuramate--L-alanine ligase [Lentimicrobium sp.]HPJ61375.1 UDP-N-acetylmuramate--L-alanine ligase [Lentimicrobium sp.]